MKIGNMKQQAYILLMIYIKWWLKNYKSENGGKKKTSKLYKTQKLEFKL